MVEFFDISDWEEHKYFNTGGTRNKIVVENPQNGKLYYFKTSLKKELKDYTYEFWSEIIASEIGELLGFNILHYNVAFKFPQIGCLSESMIEPGNAELQEGYKWLTGYDPSYNVEDREAYTFQLIKSMLQTKFPRHDFLDKLIETIIFDSIIGNEDRHQENWSIIVSKKAFTKQTLWGSKSRTITTDNFEYAPIYDSGSSLGRELNHNKIKQMLQDDCQLNAYVNRGKSEIHWQGEHGKQKHFELIQKIAANGHKETIERIIRRIKEKRNDSAIENIIYTVDQCLPQMLSAQKIPHPRKELLNKLVSLRLDKLIGLSL